MREIKFRLLDRFNKIVGYEKWYTGCWHPDDPDKGFSLVSGYWEAQPCWLYSIDGETWTPNPIYHQFKDQYAGLKDSRDKEIYENDIVEPVPNAEVKYQVKWNEYIAGFHLVGINHPSYLLDIFVEPFERVVIGNIHDNKELMEKK